MYCERFSGFTVALGLYILLFSFGIGKGLQNAFQEGFTRDAQILFPFLQENHYCL